MGDKKMRIVWVTLIVLLAAFFRFYNITETPPGLYPDEAMNGNNAVEALKTGTFKIFYPENNGREGLFINIQALSVWMFGNEPWALRIVSAVFGTLTIFGLYLLTRELFYARGNQKFQAPISKQIKNSNIKNSKLFRILKFSNWKSFGNFDFGFGNSRSELIALLASFFLATSFWHINFSRIGFRAIMVPFFLVWSFYFLYRTIRALREKSSNSFKPELFAVLGGVLFGLGFHTYIAYRLAPLLLISPFLLALNKNLDAGGASDLVPPRPSWKCAPCLLVLFMFAAFVATLPIGYYFLQHPEDFMGRTGQVSAFAADSPQRVIGLNIVKTIGMFFWAGDYNWRHNFAGKPQLWWPVGILFLIGIMVSLQRLIQNVKIKMQNDSGYTGTKSKNFTFLTVVFHFALYTLHLLATPAGFLLLWLTAMSLPAIISSEGIPHALRTIGMIPPVMILAALGFVRFAENISLWLEKQKKCWPDYTDQLTRITWELRILAVIFLIAIPVNTAKQYFFDWAYREETRNAFSVPYTLLGKKLMQLPPELPKYVIVNADGVLVRGVPMPAQTVMFVTEGGIATYNTPTAHTITYLLSDDEKKLDSITAPHITVRLHP